MSALLVVKVLLALGAVAALVVGLSGLHTWRSPHKPEVQEVLERATKHARDSERRTLKQRKAMARVIQLADRKERLR